MQPERLHGRESGAQSWRGFLVPHGTKMNTLVLRTVESELRLASQSLWDFRTKDGATVELSTFLSPAQDSLALLLETIHDARVFLETREAN